MSLIEILTWLLTLSLCLGALGLSAAVSVIALRAIFIAYPVWLVKTIAGHESRKAS